MITTLAEVKANLGISGTDDDTRISSILNNVELEFIKEVNNRFLNPFVKYQSATISFENKVITDVNAEFSDDEYFVAGWVYVTGSVHNNGWHEVSEITNTTLTVVSNLVTEDSSYFITIQLAKFPNELKLVIAEMIGEIINKDSNEMGLKSESLGSHSKTWADGYSDKLQRKINSYKSLY